MMIVQVENLSEIRTTSEKSRSIAVEQPLFLCPMIKWSGADFFPVVNFNA